MKGKILVAFIRSAILFSWVYALGLQEERNQFGEILISGLFNDDLIIHFT
jgi:hypothetical protein